MNDDNFDKIFSDKLKAGKDFSFTEAKWQKMENHLDTYLSERRQKRRWLLLAIPLFAILGLLGVGGRSFYQAQCNIQDLTTEIKALRLENTAKNNAPSVTTLKEANQTVVKKDTIYQHIVIKRYDTVIQTYIVKRELSETNSRQQNGLKSAKNGKVEMPVLKNTLKLESTTDDNAQNLGNASSNQSNMVANAQIMDIKESSMAGNNAVLIENNNKIKENLNNTIADSTHTIADKNPDILAKIDSLNRKADKIIVFVETELKKKDNEQNKKPMPIIKPIKLPLFEIGVSTGLAFLTGRNILKQDGYCRGGRVGLLLNEHFKIVGEAQYLALNYSVAKIDETNDIPTINPPTRNDVFLQVNVEQPYWHYALGLEYAIGHQRFKPFVGMSVFGQTKLEEKFEYKFISLRRRNDVYVYTDRHDNSFQTPFLRLRTGAEYPIFKQINAQAEASFDIKTRKLPQFQPLWQLKGSVLYRF